jgi:3-oxoacyl-[acyl-carrier protein] reductase
MMSGSRFTAKSLQTMFRQEHYKNFNIDQAVIFVINIANVISALETALDKQRIVLISGASAGIGRAMALAFAARGDHVVIADIVEDKGRDAAAEIVMNGGSAEFHRLDVSRARDVEDLAGDIVARRGPIGVAIANAGIVRRVSLADLHEQAWDEVLNVNLKGAAQLLRAGAMSMVEAGREGVLLAVSSISARTGWQDHVHYNASKAGIEGLIRGLAVELGPKGIRVNAVLPGAIRTAQALSEEHSLGEAGLAAMAGRIPLQRVGEPADIADVAVFLCSHAARYITGQSIIVDGGLSIASY